MSATELSKVQRVLLYGLKQFQMPRDEAAAIVAFLEEDDQVLLIDYMVHHKNATPQDILNESGRLLKQRKELMKQPTE